MKKKKKKEENIARYGNYFLTTGNNKEEIYQTTGPIVLASSGRLLKGNWEVVWGIADSGVGGRGEFTGWHRLEQLSFEGTLQTQGCWGP